MKLPVWARKDPSARLKFFCITMAMYHGKDCTVRQLAIDSGLHFNSVSYAQAKGRMTRKMAVAVAKTAPESGVKAIWLIAPELLQLNEHGEIIE